MIRWTEIDGIPAIYTEDGPTVAGITFRVGYADEVLAQHGITHLIEHLALHRLGTTDYHFNGTTAPSFTSFFTEGSPESVRVFLERVCGDLHALPVDRLDVETGVLRTEASSRGLSTGSRLSVWRYGAKGIGLAAYPEWGLHSVTALDLQAWASRYFTRQNAVLWFSGMTPPSDLRLPLPPGRREPLPFVAEAMPAPGPASAADSPNALGFSAIVERSAAAQAYAALLQREMFQRIRQDAGYCYTAVVGYEALDAERAMITAVADITDGQQPAAVGEFIDVLATLQWGELGSSSLDEQKQAARTARAKPEWEAGALPSFAQDVLLGKPIEQAEQLQSELDAVRPFDVQNVAQQASRTGLLLTPQGIESLWAGFTPIPLWSENAVTGRPVAAMGDENRSVVWSNEGVSAVGADGALTVRYADCQAMLMWPDGGRVLVGGDGIAVSLEPTLYAFPPEAMQTVDAYVSAQRVVRMPARSPEAIPVPPQPNAPATGGEAKALRRERRQARADRPPRPPLGPVGRTFSVLGLLVLIPAFLFGLLVAIVLLVEPMPEIDTVGIVTLTLFVGGYLVGVTWAIIAIILRMRR